MFGRKLKPVLDLTYVIKNPHLEDISIREIKFYFKNEGRAVAKYSGFIATFMQNLEIVSVNQLNNISSINTYPSVSWDNNIGVIHPNGITHYLGSVMFKFPDPYLQVTGNLQYYCDGMMTGTKMLIEEVSALNALV